MTNEQIIELISDVVEAESAMIEVYNKIIKSCKNEKIKRILKKINKDEKQHLENANKILEILNS